MTNNTIDILVDGETVEVQVEELSSLEIMRWAAKAPDALKQGDPNEVKSGPELIDFMVELATEQTVMTEELLKELDQEELGRFLSGVVSYAFGEEPDLDRDEPQTIDFNEDGSVDLGDWE